MEDESKSYKDCILDPRKKVLNIKDYRKGRHPLRKTVALKNEPTKDVKYLPTEL